MDKVKRGQFIASARQVLEPLGYNVRGPLAQADHETGLFDKIVGWNNFWGIKVPKRRPWTGKVVRIPTTEIFKGNDLGRICRFLNELDEGDFISAQHQASKKLVIFKILADFCDWKREGFAFQYYDGLIRRLYPQAHAVRDKPRAFVRALVIGGKYQWATDPNYMKKMGPHLARAMKEVL